VRISTDEAVDFSRTRGTNAGRRGSEKADVAASEHTRPFESLTPASTSHEATRPGLRNGEHVDQNWNTMAAYVLLRLGELTIAEVRRKHVSNLLRPIWREKHETARRIQGRLREVFELAVAEELREDNPAAFDPKMALGRLRKSTKHHGSLPPAEVQDLWDWLLTTPCSEKTRGFVLLILLTARRSGEGRFAVWSDFDLGELSWDELAQSMDSLRPGDPVLLVI
jgi:integrase